MSAALKERILVVDDEPQVLVALEDLLSDDFTVFTTESADKALRVAESERDIAVVLSDQRMPRMTGDQLFASLEGRSEATRILVTGFADLSAVVRAVNNGRIFAYVTKPWNPDDLRLMVHRGAEYFRLAQELAYERNLLHDLMNNVPDGIYFKDRDLRFLRANKACAALLDGGDPDVLVGRRLAEITARDGRAAEIEREEHRVLEDGRPALDVIREYRRDGRRSWFSESVAPIQNPGGDIIGLVGISRDVTGRVEVEEALRTSEERLALTFQGSAAGLFDWNVMTGEISYSPSFGALLGYSDASWWESLHDLRDRIHPADLQSLRDALAEHLGARTPFNNVELRARVSTGEYHWFLASGQAVWSASGAATRLAGSMTDITERKKQDARIARLTRIHAVLAAISSAIVRTSDGAELIRESCRIATEVGQFALAVLAEVEPSGEIRLIAWDRPDNAFMNVVREQFASGERHAGDVIDRLVAGREPLVFNDLDVASAGPRTAAMLEYGYRALTILPLFVAGRVAFIFALYSEQAGFFDSEEMTLLNELGRNISFALEHAAQLERMSYLAHHDLLTSLPNREFLLERIALQIAAQGPIAKLALVLLDVGRFGQVNEMLGRRGGDELLTRLAERFTGAMRGQDTLTRFHGNTFAILIGGVEDEADIATFIEKNVLMTLREPFVVAGTELRISARAGIAVFPSDGTDSDVLIRNAEAALRNAKSTGRQYMFYAPPMNARVAEKLTLETKLRRAIEKEEFLLFYQPKVDLRSGRVIGLEALIRWRDPAVGLVPPGQFIPVLEDTGLILEVGSWVLGHAAEQYTAWRHAGLNPPRIAVNVSAIQLGQRDFVDTIDSTIRRYPMAREGLDVEITESVFVDDLTGNADKLRATRERGFRVAIDDFGTGYSSLGYLSRLPIDALKIDRSFVIRMVEDPQDTAIVTTIISLAHALELKVVAEGVETLQQAQLLHLLKCDEAQGYLAAKPQPAEDVVKLLGSTLLKLGGQKN
jgi:diguanylate cyclase (GGDEF)-like protein/PAS domain S-box-containing protein